jgi:serine/threonine protein kinase
MSFTLLGNRYQVLQTLGSGGFGTTYLAEDIQMPSRRKCVIKQLKPIANNPEIYQLVQARFQREAAILETLGDESNQIPKLYAYFAEAGEFYLIQEWIEGMTLRDKVQAEGPLPEPTVRQILLSLLPVLSYVHDRRIVHRDIKPDNIILRRRDNQPFLIDFGAVRETMGTIVNSQGGTASSIVIGTPGFMPSEQAAGRPLYSSDLYSLGLTMIYLLTGKFPQELELDPATGEVIWRYNAPHISSQLADVLEKAIQSHPRDRYPTAQAMLMALQAPLEIAPTVLPLETAPIPPTEAAPIAESVPTEVQASEHPLNHELQVPPTVISGSSQPIASPATGNSAPVAQQFGSFANDASLEQPQRLPIELDRWNWGATLLPGLWSINNRVWIGLIAWSGLITCGIGWLPISIMLGAKGSDWAWRNRRWRSVEAFKANQRAWATAGMIVWGIYAVLIALLIVVGSQTPETQEGETQSGSPSLFSGSADEQETTNVFGETLRLRESSRTIDGTWSLNYTIANIQHQGTLTMQGKTGELRVHLVDQSSQQSEHISQTMRLWESPRGLVLLGYNPIDLSTQAPHSTYAPDNFLFELNPGGSLNATVCDDARNCTEVVATAIQ